MCCNWDMVLCNLLPALPTIQVLIAYSMQKQGGGRPGSFYHVNDISVYLGRQRGRRVPNQKNAFRAHTLCFEPGVVHFSFSNVRNSSVWGTNHKISLQAHSFNGGSLPPSVYLYMIKLTKPSSPFLHTASDPKLDGGKAY